MTAPAARPHINPDVYLRIAFDALHWVGWTYEAAMFDTTRRRIIEFIAHHYPPKMETIVSIARIEQLAHKAAAHHPRAADAQPYPAQSAAAGLFVLCFESEQKRLQALALRAQSALQATADARREARLAAAVPAFTDVHDACPYPAGTLKACAFNVAFLQARQGESLETEA